MGLKCLLGKHDYGEGCICTGCKKVKKISDYFTEDNIVLLHAILNERIVTAQMGRNTVLKNEYAALADALKNPEGDMTAEIAKTLATLGGDCLHDTSEVGELLFSQIRPFLLTLELVGKTCMKSFRVAAKG